MLYRAIQPHRATLLALLLLGLTSLPICAQRLTTGDRFVSASVDAKSGRIWFMDGPGGTTPPSGPAMSRKLVPSTGAVVTKTGATPPIRQKLAQARWAMPVPGRIRPA